MTKSLEGVLIKAPHKRQPFTEAEMLEFMDCADPVSGPAYFLDHFFNIQHPTQQQVYFTTFHYVMIKPI